MGRTWAAQVTCLFREYLYTHSNEKKLNINQNVTLSTICYERIKNQTQITCLLKTYINSSKYWIDNNVPMSKYVSILIGEGKNSQLFRGHSPKQWHNWLVCYILLVLVCSKKMHIIICATANSFTKILYDMNRPPPWSRKASLKDKETGWAWMLLC